MMFTSKGAKKVDELRDVDAATPAAGDALVWNGAAWVPVASATPGDLGATAAATLSSAQSYADTVANAAVNDANDYTDAQVAGLVSSAPEVLDTLNELAVALGNDPNFATSIAAEIGTKADAEETEAALATKAALTYVDAADTALAADVATKADAAATASSLAALNTAVATKADAVTVQGALDALGAEVETKADQSDLTAETSARTAAIAAEATARANSDNALALLKADKSYVDTADAALSDAIAAEATARADADALKANKTYVDAADAALAADVATKASQTALTAEESARVAADALKADTTYVDTQLATKSDTTHTHTLDALSDVDAATPANDDVLKFDAALGKWKAGVGAQLRTAVVSAYNPATRLVTVTYDDDDSSEGSIVNLTAVVFNVGDDVVVTNLTGGSKAVIATTQVSYDVGSGSAGFFPQATASSNTTLFMAGLTSSSVGPVDWLTLVSTNLGGTSQRYFGGWDISNATGNGARALIVTNGTEPGGSQTASAGPSLRIFQNSNLSNYTEVQYPNSFALVGAHAFSNAIFALGRVSADRSLNLYRCDLGSNSWSTLASAQPNGLNIAEANDRLFYTVYNSGTSSTITYYVESTDVTTALTATTLTGSIILARMCAGGGYLWAMDQNTYRWYYRPANTTSPWVASSYIGRSAGPTGAVDSNGDLWIFSSYSDITKVSRSTGAASTFSGVLPATNSEGRPIRLGVPSAAIGGEGVWVMGILLDSAVGGATANHRYALWRVTSSGSTRVWTSSTVDASATDATQQFGGAICSAIDANTCIAAAGTTNSNAATGRFKSIVIRATLA